MSAIFEYAPSAPTPVMSLDCLIESPPWRRLLLFLVMIGTVTLAAGCPPEGDTSRDSGMAAAGDGDADRSEGETARMQAIYDEMTEKNDEAAELVADLHSDDPAAAEEAMVRFRQLLERLKELAEEFIAEWGDDATPDELGYPMQVFFEVSTTRKEWEDIFPKADIVIDREMNSEIEPMAHFYKALAMINLDYPEEDILREVEQIAEGDPRRAEILMHLAGRPGKAVPTFSLPSLANAEATYSSEDLIGEGHVTLIVFWSALHEASITFLRRFVVPLWLEREGATSEDDLAFALLTIAIEVDEDNGENERQVVEDEGFAFPVAFDEPGETSMSYGVSGTLPWLCYIGADGTIIRRGFAHEISQHVLDDLEERFGPVDDNDDDGDNGDGNSDEGGEGD